MSKLRIPDHRDALTFDEQIDLERQMSRIANMPVTPKQLTAGEWENVQRMA